MALVAGFPAANYAPCAYSKAKTPNTLIDSYPNPGSHTVIKPEFQITDPKNRQPAQKWLKNRKKPNPNPRRYNALPKNHSRPVRNQPPDGGN